ncbi:unnamed protein product [Rodentolepis nana]|uniref:Secreted protein n=1 Tax=Rodentolepis nana TaxID=102285 RepID=A0A0R3TJD1_RODNA|nr:unnamed protein product [Rodentolepis nana]
MGDECRRMHPRLVELVVVQQATCERSYFRRIAQPSREEQQTKNRKKKKKKKNVCAPCLLVVQQSRFISTASDQESDAHWRFSTSERNDQPH